MLNILQKSNIKPYHKLLIFLLLTLFLILLGILYTQKHIQPRDHEKTAKEFQKQLNTHEIILNTLVEEIKLKIIINSFNYNQFFSDYSKNLSDEGLIILIFEDDTLKYWSDNTLNVFDFYDENTFDLPAKKLSNGWYQIKNYSINDQIIVGLIKIKNEYAIQNQYLKNNYSIHYNIDDAINISSKISSYNIYSLNNEFLFSLHFPSQYSPEKKIINLLFFIYLLALIFFIITLYQAYQLIGKRSINPFIINLGFIIDILLIRVAIFYFEYPQILYNSHLFKPGLFANSSFFPSLADLIINSIIILFVAFSVHKSIKTNKLSELAGAKKILITSAIIIYIFFLGTALSGFLRSIIVNSSISYNLNQITTINIYSILGFLSIGFLILSYVFLTFKLSRLLPLALKSYIPFFSFIIFFALFQMTVSGFLYSCDRIHVIFPLIYLISFWFIEKSKSTNLRFSSTLFFIFLFSVFTTYILYKANSAIEKEKRKIIAQYLAAERDPIAEYNFNKISQQLKKDSLLISRLSDYPFSENIYSSTLTYLTETYFRKYISNYEFKFTFCDEGDILEILTEDILVNCNEFFGELIQDKGNPTNYPNLFTIYYVEIATKSYLGIINFDLEGNTINLYVEFFPKFIPKGTGYPELLIEKDHPKSMDLAQYSYARYENGKIVYFFGKYFYSMSLEHYKVSGKKDEFFFEQNRFSHLFHQVNENTAYLVSIEKPGFIDIVAPFSYVFIFFGILALLLLKSPLELKAFDLSFKNRLQIFITGLILISFLFIGAGSLYYIITLNDNKNHDILSEKTHSVLIELEHKLANEDAITTEMKPYISEILYKFSLVFFSDINMYDLNGTLLATSRDEIFEKGLLSQKMDPDAYNYLQNFKKSLYIHRESIGDYNYLSAYVPFRNADNKLIAFLNLPYFARQDELTKEISTFLVAFINIYVILITIAIFIALIVANYITKPLQLIKYKISMLKLGTANEKIEWAKNDEIGSLIAEYNRMVDELEKSAELLAKSERESAWREMAKQIAHEIKNPLTPMKLSVQYLQKAWDEKAPEWDNRLKKFTQTIIEQIDSLSIIASEFSNFAKMPKSKFEKTDITEVIHKTIDLFKNSTSINFTFQGEKPHYIWADKEQMIRVFNNLTKNSIQAITDTDKGKIMITLEREDGFHIIRFADNGRGISKEQRDKVFYPSFTTKSGGMGLGLAMVKNIIQNAGGEITFDSEENQGTTFIILLPVFNE